MVLSLFLAGFLAASAPNRVERRLWPLYEKRDFFSLQHDLPPALPADSARLQFLRAQTDAAFGRYEDSSRILRRLLQMRISGASLERGVRERLMLNERALFHYRAALSAIAPVMQSAGLRNRAALLATLQGALPEVSRISGGAVALHADRFGAVQASVNGMPLRLGVDTGANLSVLSRSAAHKVGLRIRAAGYRVRLANGRPIVADIALSQLRLGAATELSNVVFLVLPDFALRMGGRQMLDGLIGLPELSQLGNIQFGADGTVRLHDASAAKIAEPIALIEGDPVVRATLGTEQIFCRIDTGSNRTVFYGTLHKRTSLALEIAKRKLRFQHPVSRLHANQPFVNCSLGRDALRQIEPYTLDLHTMQLGLN